MRVRVDFSHDKTCLGQSAAEIRYKSSVTTIVCYRCCCYRERNTYETNLVFSSKCFVFIPAVAFKPPLTLTVHMPPTGLVSSVQEGVISGLKVSYLREEESWVKWTAILSGLVVSWAPGAVWARPLASCSVLAAWVELLYLFANTPLGGLKLLMFFHVTKTVLKVLSTFMFLIVGFALSFTVLFEGKPPFQEMWPALSQTVAMMSELGYNDVFQVEELPHPLARPIFLLYLILVGTVLSNLLVGMSVSDVAELEASGRALKTAREAKFLVVFEMLCYQKCLQPFLFWISRQSTYEDLESVSSKNPDPQEFLNVPPEVELCELPEGLLGRMMSEVERREEEQRRRMRSAGSEQGSPDSLRQTLFRTYSRARH